MAPRSARAQLPKASMSEKSMAPQSLEGPNPLGFLRHRCKICTKLKPVNQFSQKQYDTLRAYLESTKGRKSYTKDSGVIICKICAGAGTAELECHGCDKVMPLTEFAKAHRSNPDTAKCISCMQRQVSLDPAHESIAAKSQDFGQDDDYDSDDSNPYNGTDFGSDLASTMGGVSLNDNNTATNATASGDWVAQARRGATASTQRTASTLPQTNGSSLPNAGMRSSKTSYEPPDAPPESPGWEMANQRPGSYRRGPSSNSFGGSQPAAKGKSSKWAKVKAPKPDNDPLGFEDSEEEKRQRAMMSGPRGKPPGADKHYESDSDGDW